MALLKVAHVSGDGVGPDRVRRLMATLAGDGEGIVDSGDFLVSEKSGTPNMSVDVAIGRALVTGTEATTQGLYLCETDTVTNLVIGDGDASNPRIDVVVAQVRDSDYSGVDDDWRLFVVVGTPAGSPVAPAIPANSLKLAEVTVDALESTSILDADAADSRVVLPVKNYPRGVIAYKRYTAATGGIVGTNVSLNGGPVTATLVAGRLYRVSWHSARWFSTATATFMRGLIGDGTTDFVIYEDDFPDTGGFATIEGSMLYTGSGSVTFTGKAVRISGAGTCQIDTIGSASAGWIVVEDIGVDVNA